MTKPTPEFILLMEQSGICGTVYEHLNLGIHIDSIHNPLKNEIMEKKFKPFWICTVNGWIVGASYSGKELKAKHWGPSFRKFRFIRDYERISNYKPHPEITNIELVRNEGIYIPEPVNQQQ